jgi:hypothetical protein
MCMGFLSVAVSGYELVGIVMSPTLHHPCPVALHQQCKCLTISTDATHSATCSCPDGKIRLFCKGADTVIMTRVRQGQPNISHVRSHLVRAVICRGRT